MPWNDNSGNGGGPWGQVPPGGGRGGRGGGPQPPDLEELLRRGQDRMKNVLPGGSLGGSGVAIALLILALVYVVWTSVYIVEADEEGVVLRFGKYVRTTGPGLHVHLPYPIETAFTPQVRKNNQINIGVNPTGQDIPSEGLMLTGDENIANVQFSVFWQIKPAGEEGEGQPSGAANFLFNVQNPEQTVKAVAESAMREVVGRTDLQPIITEGRRQVEESTQAIIQETLDNYGAGILVTQVQVQKADPPDPVIDAFRDVVAAQQDQDRVVNEARAYANRIVPEARGEGQRIIQQAEAYRTQTVVEANGQATRFNSIYNEYRQAKGVTRERIFLETMERVLGSTNKVVIEGESGPGVVPYLPLPEIRRRAEEGGAQ